MNKKLIFEHLEGRATPLGNTIISQWLAEPENQELYYEWLDEWENGHLQFMPDDNAALKKLWSTGMAGDIATHISKPKGLMQRLLGTRMLAASVFFICLLASFFLFRGSILNKTIKTQYGEIKTLDLPDGSKVVMNANSSITYPRFGFGKSSRIVHLSGEAEFAVVHTQSHQKFIVETDKELDVIVLGTQFSVYARESQAKVVLQNGKVELSYTLDKTNKKMVMKPGDMFIANGNVKPRLHHVQHPEKLTAWKNHEFQFDATSLSEIAAIIKDNFGFEVKFESAELAGKKISGSFHAVALDELTDAISELLSINYRTKGNTIFFFQ